MDHRFAQQNTSLEVILLEAPDCIPKERTHENPLDLCCLLFPCRLHRHPHSAALEIAASKSLTVQSGGPRSGDAGSKYLNIEGKENDKYACFGVLVFEIPKEVQQKRIKGMTLTLVQSLPKFARDGAIRFFLAPDLDVAGDLKFDLSVPDGIGDHIKPLLPLGSGNFKKIETGKTESFSLTGDDFVRERISKGGKICLVIVPAEGAVAATYFGVGENAKENGPKLVLELP